LQAAFSLRGAVHKKNAVVGAHVGIGTLTRTHTHAHARVRVPQVAERSDADVEDVLEKLSSDEFDCVRKAAVHAMERLGKTWKSSADSE
jgi:hypothetical protein